MNPKISVIVPVYNGERYLYECLDSIVDQTFSDFELILLDDGSLDRSGQICDEYAGRDPRIRVIHKQNEGINATRWRGVCEAKGDWISFCDNDDSLPIDALSNLYSLVEDTDIVIGFPDEPNYQRELSLDECRRNMITAKLLPPTPWGKLYRRSLLTDEVFDFPREIDGEEDMIMNIRLMFKITRAPRICFKKVYNFRRNTASVSHTKRASLEHEEAFDQARARSIPTDVIVNYMEEILRSRLNGIVKVAYNNPETIMNWQHPYLVQLKSDLTKYQYKLNFQQRILVHIHLKYLLKLSAFAIILKDFVRYRLGLNN